MTKKKKPSKLNAEREQNRIWGLSNNDLLTETIEASKGDDYDGFFTPWGEWQLEQLKAELSQRLLAIDFLDKELE